MAEANSDSVSSSNRNLHRMEALDDITLEELAISNVDIESKELQEPPATEEETDGNDKKNALFSPSTQSDLQEPLEADTPVLNEEEERPETFQLMLDRMYTDVDALSIPVMEVSLSSVSAVQDQLNLILSAAKDNDDAFEPIDPIERMKLLLTIVSVDTLEHLLSRVGRVAVLEALSQTMLQNAEEFIKAGYPGLATTPLFLNTSNIVPVVTQARKAILDAQTKDLSEEKMFENMALQEQAKERATNASKLVTTSTNPLYSPKRKRRPSPSKKQQLSKLSPERVRASHHSVPRRSTTTGRKMEKPGHHKRVLISESVSTFQFREISSIPQFSHTISQETKKELMSRRQKSLYYGNRMSKALNK